MHQLLSFYSLAINIADGSRTDEVSITDEPPDYEAPPGYDECIKVDMESCSSRRTKHRNRRGRRRTRSTPSSGCS